MTTIPVAPPESTTRYLAGGTPRLPFSPRAQRAFSERMKPQRLVSWGSVASGAVTPEATSPRKEPAAHAATGRSAAPSTEITPRQDASKPTTPPSGRLPLSPHAQRAFSERMKPTRLVLPGLSTSGVASPEVTSPRTAPASYAATPRSAAASAEITPRQSGSQPTTPTPDRLPRSALIEQRIASFRRSASPRRTYQLLHSIAKGKEPGKLPHADRALKEHGSEFVVPEKRPPRKRRNNTDIIEGLKSLKRKIPVQDLKVPLARRETAELAMEKRGSVKKQAKFFEEQARLANEERHPVRRTHTETPAASIRSKSLRRPPPAAVAPAESGDRIDRAWSRHRAGSEKSPAKPRKPENFS
jgi:hypothetical protein